MPDFAHSFVVHRDAEAGLGVSVDGIRLGAKKAKETKHVLQMYYSRGFSTGDGTRPYSALSLAQSDGGRGARGAVPFSPCLC